jgi:hypothetical protein
MGAAPPGAARDRIFVRSGNRRNEILIGHVGIELAVVATEAQHHDPIGNRADVLHVVTDHDDAETACANAFDEV